MVKKVEIPKGYELGILGDITGISKEDKLPEIMTGYDSKFGEEDEYSSGHYERKGYYNSMKLGDEQVLEDIAINKEYEERYTSENKPKWLEKFSRIAMATAIVYVVLSIFTVIINTGGALEGSSAMMADMLGVGRGEEHVRTESEDAYLKAFFGVIIGGRMIYSLSKGLSELAYIESTKQGTVRVKILTQLSFLNLLGYSNNKGKAIYVKQVIDNGLDTLLDKLNKLYELDNGLPVRLYQVFDLDNGSLKVTQDLYKVEEGLGSKESIIDKITSTELEGIYVSLGLLDKREKEEKKLKEHQDKLKEQELKRIETIRYAQEYGKLMNQSTNKLGLIKSKGTWENIDLGIKQTKEELELENKRIIDQHLEDKQKTEV